MRGRTVNVEKIRIEERKRIGEELHSGAAQSLSHALLLLNLYEQKGKKEDFEGARQAIKMAVSEIRRSISELRNEEAWPLIPSVRDCLSEFKSRSRLAVRFKSKGKDFRVPPQVRHYLLTLILEGLQNVTKHARANSAEVLLTITRGAVTVVVKDDGAGFDKSDIHKGAPHFGLKFMAERAEQMGGELSIHSLTGRGTTLKVTIPYGK